MAPSLDWNLKVWDQAYAWTQDGDEWSEQAQACGVPYETWKSNVVKSFIRPSIKSSSQVLEIGPGHGRWSSLIAPTVVDGKLTLVDLSPRCLDFCRERLAKFSWVDYLVTDGKSLTGVPNGSVDFAWSFDTFVHIEVEETRKYVAELSRVMKRQSTGCIHHPGNPSSEQKQQGMRSQVTAPLMARMLQDRGFLVIRQTDSWMGSCDVKLAGDCITVFAKP